MGQNESRSNTSETEAPTKTPSRTIYSEYPIDDLMREDPRYQFRSAPAVTLDNPVNPIFARTKISPEIDYDAILPSLRMATLLIQTPCTQGYWGAAALFMPQTVKYADRAGTYKALYRKPFPITNGQSEEIRRVFGRLAQFVSFDLADVEDEGTAAFCNWIPRAVPPTISSVAFRGHASRICLNRTLYNAVLRAIEDYKAKSTSVEKQNALFAAHFSVSKYFGHELAHAMWYARWGHPDRTCMPFENFAFSEAGTDWEITVFGGAISTSVHDVQMIEMPGAVWMDMYLRRCATDGVTASLGALSKVDHERRWRIPPCLIRSFFQKNFWQTVVPAMGGSAFKAPRLIGRRSVLGGGRKPYNCGCESCLRAKDYVKRANNRRDGPISHSARRRVEDVPLREPKEGDESTPDDSSVAGPSGLFECIRGRYKILTGAKEDGDIHSFGLLEGFKSCLDGTVVAAEHFELATAFETVEILDLPEPLISHFRAPEDRMHPDEQIEGLVVLCLERVSAGEYQAWSQEKGLKILRASLGEERMKRYEEIEARLR